MKSLKLSQEQLGQRLGCDQSTVSNILNGKRLPPLVVALKIELQSAAWRRGPIRAVEWLSAAEKSA